MRNDAAKCSSVSRDLDFDFVFFILGNSCSQQYVTLELVGSMSKLVISRENGFAAMNDNNFQLVIKSASKTTWNTGMTASYSFAILLLNVKTPFYYYYI